jgi:hypothetical protein
MVWSSLVSSYPGRSLGLHPARCPCLREHTRVAEQDDGEIADLAGLDEGERLEQLIHGAKAAREDDEGLGVLDEHGLAHEEVAEVDGDGDVGVIVLLEGQLDVEPNEVPPPSWAPWFRPP